MSSRILILANLIQFAIIVSIVTAWLGASEKVTPRVVAGYSAAAFSGTLTLGLAVWAALVIS
ncbi:hypothetical protein AB0M36_16000 [Actinoplanes sp. NPDC051346]|uniref:hypothetical protein n=1 Tax=Actinoplanes sp. NPDC051346 TaxID=3155048 RepID=UPI00343060F4